MKILLVEDHPIVVSGCRQLFAEHANIVFHEASSSSAISQPPGSTLEVVAEDSDGVKFEGRSDNPS